MDFNALLGPIIEFFSHGIGEVIAQIGKALYYLIFPANAEAAQAAADAAPKA